MKLRFKIFALCASISLLGWAQAQEVAFLRAQEVAIQQVFNEVANTVSASSVSIISGRSQVALGTVVGPQLVITKWSDLASVRAPMSIADDQGRLLAGEAVARFPEHDLVLLRVPELIAQPVDFSKAVTPVVGSIIAAVTPRGLISHYGIISTPVRSLREADLPYLGIVVDPSWPKQGVLLKGVERKSAADIAGMKAGDIILSVNEKKLPNLFAMNSALKDTKPGQAVKIEYRRGKSKHIVEAVAGHRPKSTKFPEARLEMMNSANNRMNKVRDGFPLVFQSDMTIEPERSGGAVIDLNGQFAGVVLSRAGRIETYILPTQTLYTLIKEYLPTPSLPEKTGMPVDVAVPIPQAPAPVAEEVSDFIDV